MKTLVKKKLYDSNDIDAMLSCVSTNDTLKANIKAIALKRYSILDVSQIFHCIECGYSESFDRFDSAVCEEFIRLFEDVYFDRISN